MKRPMPFIIAAPALALLAAALYFMGFLNPQPQPPNPAYTAQYVGSATCITCHAQQGELWKQSDHHQAMDLPAPATVKADFNNTSFTHHGLTSRFSMREGKYFVATDNARGQMEEFQILHTFGHYPLQQYLIKMPSGAVQTLPITWDTVNNRWFHVYGDEKIDFRDPLHWTGPLQNWDHMCAECHSVNVVKKFDPVAKTFATSFSEIRVGCESCHGPGSKHVEIARSPYPDWAAPARHALADLKSSNVVQVENCAKCHARRHSIYPGHHAGAAFYDHYLPELLEPWDQPAGAPVYHADGQILEEAYEYGSFMQSKMHAKGVKCSDCHNSHSGKTHFTDNNLCARCHKPEQFDTPAHHRHKPGSTGSRCVDCHMPVKNYMVVDPRRDHSIRIPRPDLAAAFGTPNACTACHKDKPVAWAAEAFGKWYPNRKFDPHYTQAIQNARRNQPGGDAQLLPILQSAEAPPYLRASVLLLLRRYPDTPESIRLATAALQDPHPLLRAAAINKLQSLPPQQAAPLLAPLLDDPVRSVRTEAARVLSSVDRGLLDASRIKPLDDALAEYRQRHLANLDRPESHMALGILHEFQREPDHAEKWYRSAIDLDSRFVPGRVNLAQLLNLRSNKAEAEKLLREVVTLAPEWGDGFYSLGLLLAENEARLPEALTFLALASDKMPLQPRVHYNFALALERLNKPAEAENALLKAYQLDSASPDYGFALARFYLSRQRTAEASLYARKVLLRHPEHAESRALLQHLEQNRP